MSFRKLALLLFRNASLFVFTEIFSCVSVSKTCLNGDATIWKQLDFDLFTISFNNIVFVCIVARKKINLKIFYYMLNNCLIYTQNKEKVFNGKRQK